MKSFQKKLFLKISPEIVVGELRIFDTMRFQKRSQNISGEYLLSIDRENLESGLYFLHLRSSNGRLCIRKVFAE